MMFTTRRPTSRLDICNYNTLLYRDYHANVDFTKNYLLSHSPPPMTYRDLRSVMSNKIPSNIVILPDSFNSSQKLIKNSATKNHQKQTSRKKHKRQGVDIYRTLVRTESRASTLSERDMTPDEMLILANSFIIDHISPSPPNGYFHPQNLPNIQKHRNNNNSRTGTSHTKSGYTSSPSLRIQHVAVGQTPPTLPQHIHRTTPVDIQYEDNDNPTETSDTKSTYPSTPSIRMQRVEHTQSIPPPPPPPSPLINRTTPVDIQYETDNGQMTITTTTTINSSPIPSTPTRKQLHVYMPQILSC